MTVHPAQPIIDAIAADVDELMSDLEAEEITAAVWQDRMAATLARGHLAAYMAGQESSEITAASRKRLLKDVSVQLGFLDNFTVEIQAAAEFQKGWNARAAMYAEQTGASYFQGKFRMWPLPDVPRSGGTQCLSRCNCRWEIEELAGDGNARAYWKLGPGESCQGCVERSEQWNPIVFKDGVLQ